jgi:hypothetical protein
MSGRQKESLICCKAEKGCCTRWANLHAAHRPVATLFLRQRMGQWRPTFARDRRWPAYQTRYWLFIQSARTPTLFHAHSDSLQGRLPSRSFNAQPTLRTNNPLAYEGVAPAEFQAPRHGLIPAMCSINFFQHDDSDAIPNLPSTIFAHLDQLEPWESSLFPYVMPMANPLTLKEHLEDPESGPLFLVHDGGAAENGSFGWMIGSNSATYWEGSGPTAGRKPGSFRAKGYGMLAALRFLLQYLHFFNITPACPGQVHFEYTDSKALLGHLASSIERFYPSPGACLASEFDIESAILHSIKLIGLTFERKHVKGHQDKEQEIQTLNWPAQLNCQCDHMATQQLRLAPLYTKVIKNPYCNAYVTIRGESVTGQIRKALFDAAGRPRLRTYLMEHFQWTDDTFSQVHWNDLLSAICGLSVPEHTFVIKLAFKLLPIGFRLQQRQAHMPTWCPSCDEPMEDDWHWLTCGSRAAWCLEQKQLFSAHLVSLKTHPSLKFIASRAFASILSTGDCNFDDAQLSIDETSLVHSQASIRWPNMLFGRFSVEWARIQDEHIAEQHLDGKYFSGPDWTTKI